MKFIFDTDIGDDIDDSLAIDLALRLGFDIIGVTTVYRNTVMRARIAKRQLALFGRADIPVYAGYGNTLAGGEDETMKLCQYTPEIDAPEYAPDGTGEIAVDFLIESAKKYGDDLTIIAIGPLTNLACAIQKDPEALRGVHRILTMSGDFVHQYSEWNILCDVEAAQVVYEAELPMICFGHEITRRTTVTQEMQNALFTLSGTPYREYLAELVRLWYKSKTPNYLVVLHDVLTAYYAVAPEFFKTVKTLVKVETKGEATRGMTVNLSVMDHFDLSKARPVEYAQCDKAEEFAKIYFDIINKEETNHEKSGKSTHGSNERGYVAYDRNRM